MIITSPTLASTAPPKLNVEGYRASEIVPGLYQGPAPPPGRYRVHTIVLAAKEYQPDASLFPGVDVIHAPLDDDPGGLSPQEVKLAIRTGRRVAADLRRGRRVLVTCYMGLNRSGIINAIALCDYRKTMCPEYIVKHIQRARGPVLFAGRTFQALSNQAFVQFLHGVCRC